MDAVPLAPTEMFIDDDAVNVKGPTDDEGKIVQPESNETFKVTVCTSEAMDAEHAVQGCKRQISDSYSDGKTQHRRARINLVPNLSAGKRKDKTASASAVKKAPTNKIS